MCHGGTEWCVPLSPSVPLGPAAHRAGLALLDAGLEVVVRVCVAGVLSKVQLLHLGHDQVVVVVGGHVWVYYPHDASNGRVVTKNEIVWIMYKNLMNKFIF